MEISKEIQDLQKLTVLYVEDDEDTLNLTQWCWVIMSAGS